MNKTEYKRQKRREYNDKYKLKQWNKNKLFVNRVKRIFGCCECGYNKKPQAMDFHHLKDKKFAISVMVRSGFTIKLIKEEIRKCRLLCGNCHRKVHNTDKKKHSIEKTKAINTYKIYNQCIFCKESDIRCLDLHHRDPSQKTQDISRMLRSVHISLEQLLTELAKCDVVCVNCHRELHNPI